MTGESAVTARPDMAAGRRSQSEYAGDFAGIEPPPGPLRAPVDAGWTDDPRNPVSRARAAR